MLERDEPFETVTADSGEGGRFLTRSRSGSGAGSFATSRVDVHEGPFRA